MFKVFENVPIHSKQIGKKDFKNHAGRLKNNPSIIAVSVMGPVRKMTSLIKKSKSISKRDGVVGTTLVVISTRKPQLQRGKFTIKTISSFSSELGQVTFLLVNC